DVVGAIDPATGSLAASAALSPFGASSAAAGIQPALGFQSGWSSGGLLNTASRWYDPSAGAFTSRDTWTLDPATNSTNRYTYATNPVADTDPTGHFHPDYGGSTTGPYRDYAPAPPMTKPNLRPPYNPPNAPP